MNVIRNTEPWQVSTNFVISTTAPESIDSVCWRYRRASEGLAQKNGNLSPEDAMMLLKDVAQSDGYPTIWSTVYNLKTGNIQVVMGRKYTDVHEFRLEMKRKEEENKEKQP
jgi:hypothetical protein